MEDPEVESQRERDRAQQAEQVIYSGEIGIDHCHGLFPPHNEMRLTSAFSEFKNRIFLG